MKTIFTVHGMSDVFMCKGYLGLHRTYGWYSKAKDAQKSVKENKGDLYECAYRYIIIEEVKEGVWAGAFKGREWWYEWNRKEKKYVPIEKPEELCNVTCFAMG